METLQQWLKGKCKQERLSVRNVGIRCGLSHTTIAEILKGQGVMGSTIKKLAQGFATSEAEKLALEDKLLILAGFRSERPEESTLTESQAHLIAKVKLAGEAEVEMMLSFASFLKAIKRTGAVDSQQK